MTRSRLVPLALAVAAAAPAGADPWRATVELGGEVDSNVRRVEGGTAGVVAAPLARAQVDVIRRDGDGPLRSAARGLLGLRRAVAGGVTSEDLLTAGVDLAFEHDGPGEDVALLARATHYDVFPVDGADGTRAFASSGADLGLRLAGGAGRAATLTAGVRRLRYKPDDDFDWSGPAAAVAITDELWRGRDEQTLELHAGYRLERRGYRGRAYTDGCAPGEPAALTCFVPTHAARADLHHVVSAELTYTGERVLAAAYKLVGNDSSSFGSSFVRHRLTVSATTPAPGRLFVTAAVTAQLDRYLDPLLIASDVAAQTFESIEEENRSAVSVRVARVLSPCWQLEARAALYANAFAADDREFRRLLVYGGLTWERAPDRE